MRTSSSLLLVTVVSVNLNIVAADTSNFVAAGCFIATPQGVVLSVNHLEQLQLPMGHRKSGETGAETAIRETKEETGLDAEIQELITALDNGSVLLFRCTPKNTIDSDQLSPMDKWEVKEVLVMNPHTRKNFDGRHIKYPWRFRETEILLRSIYPN